MCLCMLTIEAGASWSGPEKGVERRSKYEQNEIQRSCVATEVRISLVEADGIEQASSQQSHQKEKDG